MSYLRIESTPLSTFLVYPTKRVKTYYDEGNTLLVTQVAHICTGYPPPARYTLIYLLHPDLSMLPCLLHTGTYFFIGLMALLRQIQLSAAYLHTNFLIILRRHPQQRLVLPQHSPMPNLWLTMDGRGATTFLAA